MGKLARARLHFVKESHVLDRDHRLVGEGSRQIDLFLGKWPRRPPRNHEDADRISVTQQGNTQNGPEATSLRSGHGRITPDVAEVPKPAVSRCNNRTAIRSPRRRGRAALAKYRGQAPWRS